MRLKFDAKTDISVEIASERPIVGQHRYTNQPKRWSHFASSFVAIYPFEESIDGRIVLDVGDVLLPLRNCSFELGGKEIIRTGKITEPSIKI